MHFMETNDDPIETIERLFHAAIARSSSGNEIERTLKGVLQSDFGVQEFFHTNQFNLHPINNDVVRTPRFIVL